MVAETLLSLGSSLWAARAAELDMPRLWNIRVVRRLERAAYMYFEAVLEVIFAPALNWGSIIAVCSIDTLVLSMRVLEKGNRFRWCFASTPGVCCIAHSSGRVIKFLFLDRTAFRHRTKNKRVPVTLLPKTFSLGRKSFTAFASKLPIAPHSHLGFPPPPSSRPCSHPQPVTRFALFTLSLALLAKH